ncbi:5555_t:CDS:2 [Funneliformis caledonium]|uniref:5555_t:CDS:1 n=1 Tax=Funneliformis caledonium TaxID=1117310 RepID=A0A9N9DJS6_9GLOM|nr:5555_t:CDS:2 [Funneliformis caledonium]
MFSEECTRPKHKRKFWYHKNNENSTPPLDREKMYIKNPLFVPQMPAYKNDKKKVMFDSKSKYLSNEYGILA